MKFLLTLVGSFLNRVRGGLFDWLPCNKIFYPLFIGALICTNIETFICGALAAYVGQQIVGWGSYIGSLTCGVKPSPECAMIDEIINELHITFKGHKVYLTDYPRAWGFVGLMIRGLIWTFLIGLAMNNINVMLSGVLMPVAYTIPTILLLKTKYNNTKTAWNIGEWIWGFILTTFIIYG